jgi:hypothetical protein
LVEWNDYADDVRDELNRQAEAFGQDLGPAGWFVRAYDRRMFEIADEVIRKEWPAEIAERFRTDQEPIILILDRDWMIFDPREHPYGVIWLSDFSDKPENVRILLKRLALGTREGEDIVAYLQDVAARQRMAAMSDRAERGVRGAARLASYVEVKPRVFGVAIDVKAILRDIAQRRS